MKNKSQLNSITLEKELKWFAEVLELRSAINAASDKKVPQITDATPPILDGDESNYAHFVAENQLDYEERLVLILALIPHLRPELLDTFLQKNESTQQTYTEFGGKRGKHHIGFLPTGETAAFILTNRDLEARIKLMRIFEPNHIFRKQNVVHLETVDSAEPVLSGALVISNEKLDLFTTGNIRKPDFSTDFPAKLLTTQMEWDDLVLGTATLSQVREVETWLKHHQTLMVDWGMKKKLKPGYKVLFYGPSGTGKTLTASLVGKQTGRDVYKIDLSRIVSKYIGETEKNLAQVFDKAENKDWILFFDEADALFGKRTTISDAHDRYANQEVSYLLQRIEDYNGLVVLATNLKSNIDDAFIRRFQSMVNFPVPAASERLLLWEKSFSKATFLEEKVDMRKIAEDYELAGGSIINVVQYASLAALRRGSDTILLRDLTAGIRKEFQKAGRTA